MKVQAFKGPVDPRIDEIQRILTGQVEFGHPSHPQNHDSTTLAGQQPALDTHNGRKDNIAGSWVEIEIGEGEQLPALNTPVTCNHNLGVDVVATGPNVRWLVFGFQHDGAGPVGATSTISVNYDSTDAGAITPDSIDLRVYAAAPRTVSDAHPIKVTLYFIKAVKG